MRCAMLLLLSTAVASAVAAQVSPAALAFGGFTFMGSLGVGYAPAVDPGSQGGAGLLGLAAGYTWRHAPADDRRPMRQH
jgi:hypothetical protein